MMTATYASPTRTRQKEEGSIASVFSSLSGGAPALPPRFSDLKKDIWTDSLSQSWREVCEELHGVVEQIAERGTDVLASAFMSARLS
jgi:acyl carrier protein phosphodiesterase